MLGSIGGNWPELHNAPETIDTLSESMLRLRDSEKLYSKRIEIFVAAFESALDRNDLVGAELQNSYIDRAQYSLDAARFSILKTARKINELQKAGS